MSHRVLRVRDGVDDLRAGIAAIQAELELEVEFPLDVVAAAARVTSSAPLPVGEDVELVLAEADPARRRVSFTL